jgi:hypothetical protein
MCYAAEAMSCRRAITRAMPNNAFQRDAAAYAAVPSLSLGAAERGRCASRVTSDAH